MDEVFGDLFIPSQLELAVVTTLETWMPTYLRWIERQTGRNIDSIKDPVKYTPGRNSFTASKGEETPRVVVISPGTLGEPQKSAKQYVAFWRIGVGVAVSHQDETEANFLAKAYAAAARNILIHKPGLDGTVRVADLVWLDEAYDDLPIDHLTLRYKAAGVYFAFGINGAVSRIQGPTEPDLIAYPSNGQVQEVDIDLEKLENG